MYTLLCWLASAKNKCDLIIAARRDSGGVVDLSSCGGKKVRQASCVRDALQKSCLCSHCLCTAKKIEFCVCVSSLVWMLAALSTAIIPGTQQLSLTSTRTTAFQSVSRAHFPCTHILPLCRCYFGQIYDEHRVSNVQKYLLRYSADNNGFCWVVPKCQVCMCARLRERTRLIKFFASHFRHMIIMIAFSTFIVVGESRCTHAHTQAIAIFSAATAIVCARKCKTSTTTVRCSCLRQSVAHKFAFNTFRMWRAYVHTINGRQNIEKS